MTQNTHLTVQEAPAPMLVAHSGQVMATSLQVAEHFGNVMRM